MGSQPDNSVIIFLQSYYGVLAKRPGIFRVIEKITDTKVVFFIDQVYTAMVSGHPNQTIVILNDPGYQVCVKTGRK